jgi:hypothetical protein
MRASDPPAIFAVSESGVPKVEEARANIEFLKATWNDWVDLLGTLSTEAGINQERRERAEAGSILMPDEAAAVRAQGEAERETVKFEGVPEEAYTASRVAGTISAAFGLIQGAFSLARLLKGGAREAAPVVKAEAAALKGEARAAKAEAQTIKTGFKVERDASGRILVRSDYGHIQAHFDKATGHLSIDNIKVGIKRGGHGTALYKRLIAELGGHDQIKSISGFLSMDNARALKLTGDIRQTPHAKMVERFGFTEHKYNPKTGYIISHRK